MSKRRKRRKQAATQPPASADSSLPKRSSTAGADSGRASGRPRPTWLKTHGRDLRFLLTFAFLMGLYYLATTTDTLKKDFFPWYLDATTYVSGSILQACGYDELRVQRRVLDWHGTWLTIERGCDAVAPPALFLSAVLASPAPALFKVYAVLGGTAILMVVNLIRIITLFLTRIHWREAFDVMHLDIWQAAFILLAIVLWAGWASWTTKHRRKLSSA